MSPLDGPSYQARLDALAAEGVDLHGEASLVESYQPRSVLDAGCGTGRVAIELARRGIEVVGVDVDASMIAEAMRLAPKLELHEADLSTLALGRTFDVVVLAGNVPLFCPADRRHALLERCAAHVSPGGRMIAGFSLTDRYPLATFDQSATEVGLRLEDRWSTWDRARFDASSDYAVSVLVLV